MVFTGERFVPELHGQIAYEHRHRYAICGPLLGGLDVLDAACGEGYGAASLAAYAHSVVGIDIDEPTVVAARGKYAASNLSFETARCEALPFPDSAFDVVVSFETVEHLDDPDAFLREVSRVLRKEGHMIISTPNKPIYGQKGPNPFHKIEWDYREFQALLSRHFKVARIYGQRLHIVSAIGPLWFAAEATAPQVFGGDSRAAGADSQVVSKPMYFVALCSNAEANWTLEPSLYLDPRDDIWDETSSVLTWASKVHDELMREKAAAEGFKAERDRLQSTIAAPGPTAPADPLVTDATVDAFRARLQRLQGEIEQLVPTLRRSDHT